MSQVQFRLWDKKVGYFLQEASGANVLCEILQGRKMPDIVVMQYTDTKDKNGQRVCEGDIVHVSRQIIHVDPEFYDDWHNNTPEQDEKRRYLLEQNLVMIADYEEIGIVKKSQVRWSMSPYIAKTVSFEHSQVNEKWHKPMKARQLRLNRGLWVVEVIGNIYETPELYDESVINT